MCQYRVTEISLFLCLLLSILNYLLVSLIPFLPSVEMFQLSKTEMMFLAAMDLDAGVAGNPMPGRCNRRTYVRRGGESCGMEGCASLNPLGEFLCVEKKM